MSPLWGNTPEEQEFLESWLSEDTIVTALGHYDCPDPDTYEGSGNIQGHETDVSIDAGPKDGWWQPTAAAQLDSTSTFIHFGTITIIVADSFTVPEELKAQSEDDDVILTAQAELHENNAFFNFPLDIPKDATVHRAVMKFVAHPGSDPQSGSATIDITAECIGDSDPPTTYQEAEDAVRIHRSVRWDIDSTDQWPTDSTQGTPDFGQVIDEVVHHPDWVQGNDITIFFDAVATSGDVRRTIYSFDSTATAPKLIVHWNANYNEEGSGGVVVNGAADVQLVDVIQTTGEGLEVDGGATITTVYNETMNGGVVVNGTAAESVGFFPSTTGVGLEVNGIVNTLLHIRGQGGVVVNGAGVDTLDATHHPDGGVVMGPATFDNGYGYRLVVTVPAGEVTEDLTKFYLGVALDLDRHHVADANDILVTDDSTSQLYHDVRTFDPHTGFCHLFWKADLDASADNTFFVFYGRDT